MFQRNRRGFRRRSNGRGRSSHQENGYMQGRSRSKSFSSNQTRNNYYGNNYTPHMFTGGNDSGSGPSTWSSNALSMIGNDTPVTIELGGGIDGYDVEVSVSISSESSMASDNTVLIVAATVDSVHYSGPNGLPDHHSTIAGFLTAHTGDQITLDGSNDVIMDYVWSMDEDWPNNSTVTWDIALSLIHI